MQLFILFTIPYLADVRLDMDVHCAIAALVECVRDEPGQ